MKTHDIAMQALVGGGITLAAMEFTNYIMPSYFVYEDATPHFESGYFIGTYSLNDVLYSLDFYNLDLLKMNLPAVFEEFETFNSPKSEFLGIWWNQDTLRFDIDIVVWEATEESAIEIGKRHNQIAIFDILNKKEVYLNE